MGKKQPQSMQPTCPKCGKYPFQLVPHECTAKKPQADAKVLPPCPFCGSDMNIPLAYTLATNEHGDSLVICNCCGASGPSARDDKAAKKLWSKRA